MKKYLILIVLLLMVQGLGAQEIRVLEIKAQEHSLKARTAQVRDNNGDLCALVEVAAPKLEGLSFEESRHVGEVKYANGVYSVFVPVGTKSIGFKHRDFLPGTIDFGAFGVTVEGGMVYSVGLQRMDLAAEYQYLVINVAPSDAMVEIDGRVQQLSEGTASAFVQVGTSHHYRVSAAGMLTEEGAVTIVSAEQKTEVNVALRDNSSHVRIVAVDGADIYVNDRLVGAGIWEGSLAPGTFKVDARLGGQTISSEACTVQEGSADVQEFVLAVFYGSLNITSVQPNVSVALDGEDLGTTPLLKSRVLPGSHSLSARKQGFDDEVKSVVVERDKVTEVAFDLKPDAKALREQKAAEEQARREQEAAEDQARREQEARLKAENDARRTAEQAVKAEASQDGFAFAGALLGFAPGSGELSFGAMGGYAKQIGGYAKFRSNFDFTNPAISHSSKEVVWESADYSASRIHFTAGVLFHAAGPIYPYAGAGYGCRNIYARTVSDGLSLVSDHSYSGVAAEAGVLLRLGPVLCSVGISTAGFQYGDIDFGVGISF